jgi:hypothetical protein
MQVGCRFSVKSRHYLDLFTQRVKDSFTLKEAEAGNDTTRKREMKNVQESIRQLHGNIFIFSRAIEHLANENEASLGNLTRKDVSLTDQRLAYF